MSGSVIGGFIAPGKPHILLTPGDNAHWQAMRDSFADAREALRALKPDLLLLYSTQWPSIIGHQIQADPNPKWHLVDQDFHALGTMHYDLRMDPAFAQAYQAAAKARGLTARTVAYRGFPVDTGTIVALQLLNPDNEFPACVVSCNMYADRAETIVLGKAAVDAIEATGKRTVAIAVTTLSNRMWTEWIDPSEDRIHSRKDDEWNRKLLDLLREGRLEDVSQLARQFTSQAHGDSKLKAIWWLSACLGQNNDYRGEVFDYQPVWGTGAALVGLVPDTSRGLDLEYDEDNTDRYHGDRNVLSTGT
jgi:2-aminophenol/2-amino-5-chlorophenol 1,6-dioxygenase subunit alpha